MITNIPKVSNMSNMSNCPHALPRALSGGKPAHRRGVLTVEMALCIPIVFLILLGTLEFSRMNMLRNSIDNAAYEGARRGIVPGATANDCINAADTILRAVGAQNTTITVTPSVINDDTPQVSVSIATPLSSNSWGPARFLGGMTLRAVSTKSREFVGQLVPTSVP
ncbi:MAG: pilus assembly protein [Pirellulaceae bacterium]|nr:pilus assembly protein [Pirellulaceae bacterium]